MFQNRQKDIEVAGIDYSQSLVDIAKKVLEICNKQCKEAIDIDTNKQFDVVLSDSIFQYFPSLHMEKLY